MKWHPRQLMVAGVLLLLVLLGALGLGHHRHAVQNQLLRADPETTLDRSDLAPAAIALGRQGFAEHCASCHGQGEADPARGVPNLGDGDFLYGSGRIAEIEQIILHGIRSGDPRGWNLASMPAYARARPYAAEPIPPLMPGEVQDVVQFIQARHGKAVDTAAADRGAMLYSGRSGCYDCHGPDGGGDDSIGGPNLLDDVWLYGDGSSRAIALSITAGRAGVSPAFARVLSPLEARAIAVYVASLRRHQN